MWCASLTFKPLFQGQCAVAKILLALHFRAALMSWFGALCSKTATCSCSFTDALFTADAYPYAYGSRARWQYNSISSWKVKVFGACCRIRSKFILCGDIINFFWFGVMLRGPQELTNYTWSHWTWVLSFLISCAPNISQAIVAFSFFLHCRRVAFLLAERWQLSWS